MHGVRPMLAAERTVPRHTPTSNDPIAPQVWQFRLFEADAGISLFTAGSARCAWLE
jgi:hypothetical protein